MNAQMRKSLIGFAAVAAIALSAAAALVFPESSIAGVDSATLDFGVIVPVAFGNP